MEIRLVSFKESLDSTPAVPVVVEDLCAGISITARVIPIDSVVVGVGVVAHQSKWATIEVLDTVHINSLGLVGVTVGVRVWVGVAVGVGVGVGAGSVSS